MHDIVRASIGPELLQKRQVKMEVSIGIPRLTGTTEGGSNEPINTGDNLSKLWIGYLSSTSIPPLYVTPLFRSNLLKRYSLDLNDLHDQGVFRLMSYLLPGGHIPDTGYEYEDEADTTIYAGRSFIRELVNGGKNNSFSLSKTLKSFSTKYWPLIWEAGERGRCATVITNVEYPNDLIQQLMEDHEKEEPRVDLMTGETHISRGNPSSVKSIESIRQYLQNHDSAQFEFVRARIPEAIKFINSQKSSDWDKHQKRLQIQHVLSTKFDPIPQYTGGNKTTRLYPTNNGWIRTIRSVRNILTQDLHKMDLAQAQLRIAGAHWKVDLTPYEEDGSIWTHLLHYLGARKTNLALKDDLKKFVYAVLFGRTRGELAKAGTRIRGKVEMPHLLEHVEKLINHPLIVKLLEVRDEVLTKLVAGGQLVDAWGTVYRVPDEVTHKTSRKKQSRSILACVCQSYEIALLNPVFQYAEEQDIAIVGLLHDGIFCAGDWAPHFLTVQNLVREQSLKLLGVDCPLEITPAKSSIVGELQGSIEFRRAA